MNTYHRATLACLTFQLLAPPIAYSQDAGAKAAGGKLAIAQTQLAESLEKVAALEAAMEKIEAAVAGGAGFNWAIHNELRHFYAGRNPEKSFRHCEVMLRNSVMDGYILEILGGWAKDPKTKSKNLIESAEKFPRFRCISAACRIQAAGLATDAAVRQDLLNRVMALQGEGLEPYRAIAKTILSGSGTAATPTPATGSPQPGIQPLPPSAERNPVQE